MNKEENGQKELVILNLNGRILKNTEISLQEINPRELNPFTVHQGKLYQLVENEDIEQWELHEQDLLK